MNAFHTKVVALLLFALVAMVAPVSAFAQDAAKPAEPPASAIDTRVDADADSQIAARVRSIFGQIEALRSVQVNSSAGVVTLTGKVPSSADVDRAEAIAARVSGVVTVENRLSRDLAVDTNLAPALGGFGDDLRGLVRALPLMGVAAMIAIIIGAFGYFIAARDGLWRAITPNVFLAELVATSIRFVFILVAMVVALQILGATALLGAVLGGAGVIGIALGFAVRDTADNYVSSLMLSLRQPFRANDHVVIEGHEGRVVRLTSRATILITLDGNHLRIPNSTVFKSVILNYTRNPERRFEFDLGVDADDDPVDGMAVGLAAVNALDFVLNAPKATAIIQNVGDSNIVLRFFGWVDQTQTDFLKGRSLAIQAAKTALEDAGFALPEPIYRLRFDKGAALPLGDIQVQTGPAPAPPSPPKPRPAAAAGPDQDTRPDTHVEQMVRNERSESATEDLLDESKPVE